MVKTSWTDFEVYGRRNNKIIKYLETRLFKVSKDDPDSIVHYATAIGSLTRQQLEIIKIKDNYEEINSYFSILKKDRLAIDKHNMRQKEKNIQQEKHQMQYEIAEQKQYTQEDYDRVKVEGREKEDELISKKQKRKKERL